MTPKLKACPFCGSLARMEHKAGSHGYYPAKNRIVCTNTAKGFEPDPCGVELPWHDQKDWDAGLPPPKDARERSEAYLVAAWNRRSHGE